MFLAVFTDHYVTGGYWFHLTIVEIKASAAEDMVDFKITDMAMPADGTAGLEHAMVEKAALAREVIAAEQFRSENMPFAAFVRHVQFVQFIIVP